MKETKFKTKIRATDKSLITDQTIGEVIHDKIEYVIKQTKENNPYITWLSKYALVWGGKVFNKLGENNPLRVGFVSSYDEKLRKYKFSHLPGRMPTKSEQEKLERLYGVALPWPPRGLFSIMQSVFREFEDSFIQNNDNIILAPCRGYIDRNGQLVDPAWNNTEEWNSNMVSGYLIYRGDSEGLSVVQNYLLNDASSILQRQVIRTKQTAPRLREARISAANSASIKGDRRLQRLSSLSSLETKEKIEDWKHLLSIQISSEEQELFD